MADFDRTSDPARFVPGSGELAGLIRTFDWSKTPLGPIAGWPQSMKSATSFLVTAPTPMVMLWGPDGVMIYNDAYSQFAGDRHPQLLGSKVREGWAEIADFNDHVMKTVLAGGTLVYKDQELTLRRNGRAAPIWTNLDYAPLYDESGDPSGVVAIVVETTERVLADRRAGAERERQRRLLHQMPGFVGVLSGPDFVYEYVNDAYVSISERTDFIGRRFKDVFPDIAGQGFYELLDRVYRTGEGVVSRGMELRLHGSEETQYIDFVFEPVRGERGEVTGIFIGGYEITEAYRATLALKESEARLRALNAGLEREVIQRTRERGRTWEVSPDLLSVITPEGRFESVNPAWTAVLGWSAEHLSRTPYTAFVHPDDIVASREGFERLMRGDPVLRFENRYAHADGGWRWLSWVAVPIEGKFYCSARDVTAEKAAEAERDRLWTLSEDMLARADYEGRLSAVNPAWTKVLGWSQEELLTNPYADIIHPDNVATVVAALQAMNETGQPTRFENRIRTAGGVWKPIGWTVAPEPGGVHFIAVGRDISREKARERELEEAHEQLRQAQKMEAVGQLTGGLAHDFNNLLAGISGSLELSLARIAQGRAGEVERYLVAAQGAAKRAAALTHRLLAFSRRQTLDPRPTDVNRLVADMEELIRRTVGPSIAVETVAGAGLWPTLVDPHQLENALLNLCINARDAMPDGGRIAIETANRRFDERAARERDLPAGAYVSLCVTDDGTGMAPEVVERAFDPFFTTKPIGLGTGLGLSMIYGFARQSGGQVRIESELGRGTTIAIDLPRHHGAPGPAGPAAVDDAAPPAADTGETVLVVDDEPLVRMLVVDVLEELGYAAVEAGDGAEGLAVLRSDARIDLVISDVGLPGGMNGRQMADAARVLRPGLKVLFVTGYAESTVLGSGGPGPGMQVITKPFDMKVLASRIRAMISGD